jgi:AraC-like DNA-binding protein
MEKIFSTVHIHPRERFSYWHDVACKAIVSHEAEPESRLSFNAELWLEKLADVELVLFENSAMAVSRNSLHCAQARSDELFVCRQDAGTLELEDQVGRGAVLHSGDITLLDPLLPYSARFTSGSRLLVLKVPRRDLEARLGKTSDFIMRLLQTGPEQGFLSAFLAMLPAYAGKIGSPSGELLKNLAVDLIAVSFAKLLERTPRLSCAKSLTLVKVRSMMEARLTDPALDSATVAAAAGVSVRYANALLEEEGTSIARLIWSRRLERCRRALADPLQNHRTIAEIAFGWGFSDMTHFGRSFKAAYGTLPSEFRREAQNH